MIVCKYCGSHNIKTYSDSGNPFDRHPEVTVGGDNGNPFDRRPEKTVCLDCGRTINSNIGIEDLLKKVDESDKMKDGD